MICLYLVFKRLAEECKAKGNLAYIDKNYITAVEFYDQAIRKGN